MNAKCPVCDYVIEKPIEVTVGGKVVAVCCQECAEALKKQGDAKTK